VRTGCGLVGLGFDTVATRYKLRVMRSNHRLFFAAELKNEVTIKFRKRLKKALVKTLNLARPTPPSTSNNSNAELAIKHFALHHRD
jgi:hypothetical protein